MPVKDHWHRMVRGPGPADNSTSDESTRTSSSASSSARASAAKTTKSSSSKTSAGTASSGTPGGGSGSGFLSSALRWRSRKPPRLGDGLGNTKPKKKGASDDDDEWLVAFRAYKLEFGATRPPRPSRDGDISPCTTRPPSLREPSKG